MDATHLDLERRQDDLRAAGVEIVVGSVIDFAGVARGKTVPLERLGSFVTAGMGASPSWNVFCIDDTIAFTEKIGVVGDLRLHIDPSALCVVAPGVAWAPGEFTEQDGTASPLNTRGLLRRVGADLAADGYEALVGCELEFALIPGDGSFEGPWQAYGVGAVLGEAERSFIRALVANAAAVGLPLDQIHAEYGRRQVEISLGPTDPVRAADNVVLARVLIGRAAEACGLRASFSPLASVEANAANGAHAHFSFTDSGGRPVFSGETGRTASPRRAAPPSRACCAASPNSSASMPDRCSRRIGSCRGTGPARTCAGGWRIVRQRSGSALPRRGIRAELRPN